MANKYIKKLPIIDKNEFLIAIHNLGTSIRGLSRDGLVSVTEKTIRRYLNKGEMPEYLIKEIALALNIPYAALLKHKDENTDLRVEMIIDSCVPVEMIDNGEIHIVLWVPKDKVYKILFPTLTNKRLFLGGFIVKNKNDLSYLFDYVWESKKDKLHTLKERSKVNE